MRSRLIHIMLNLETQYRPMLRVMQLPSVGKPQTTRTSPKSKLKMTKAKPNVKYKSSKPVSAKKTTSFRNKSNL